MVQYSFIYLNGKDIMKQFLGKMCGIKDVKKEQHLEISTRIRAMPPLSYVFYNEEKGKIVTR